MRTDSLSAGLSLMEFGELFWNQKLTKMGHFFNILEMNCFFDMDGASAPWRIHFKTPLVDVFLASFALLFLGIEKTTRVKRQQLNGF